MSNYILCKKKPEVGDRGFIIGNRFVPIQNENKLRLKEKDTVFLISAKDGGFQELVNGLNPVYNTSEIVENEFVFNGVNDKYIQYNVSSISDLINFGNNKDFTIETVARMTRTPQGWCVTFVNTSSWKTGCIMIQFNRQGYKFSLHWNGVAEEGFNTTHDDFFNFELFHLALTRKGGKINCWVNGIKEFEKNANANANFALDSNLWIGCNMVDNRYIWNGNIKWVRISNTCKYEENFDVTNFLN